MRQGQHTMLTVPRSWLPGRSLYMWWWSHFQRKCRRGQTCNMYCVCTHSTLWPLRWHSKAICWPSLPWPSSTFCCSLPLNCESYILILSIICFVLFMYNLLKIESTFSLGFTQMITTQFPQDKCVMVWITQHGVAPRSENAYIYIKYLYSLRKFLFLFNQLGKLYRLIALKNCNFECVKH